MRFAIRDMVELKIYPRIEPDKKRLDEEARYADPYIIWAVVRPISNMLSVQQYGEKIHRMKQVLSFEPLPIGAKVEYDGMEYKIIEANRWTQHWQGIIQLRAPMDVFLEGKNAEANIYK